MKKLSYAALVLVAATLLGATVLREPVANAAAATLNVLVTNDSAHPVPVHEQGTANVNVTNGSLRWHRRLLKGTWCRWTSSSRSRQAATSSTASRSTPSGGKRFAGSFASVSGQGGPTGFTTASIGVDAGFGGFSLDLVGEPSA